MSSNSILSRRSLEETQLIVEISKLVERNDLQTALETPISIFKLSNSITNEKPESYFPHTLALGPYHHFNPELYKMEIFKLEKAKEAKERFNLPSFNEIIDEQLKPLDLKIRANFDRYLEMGSEILTWIMLIDGLFLLQLLAKESNHGRYTRQLKFPLPIFEEQKLYDGINGNLISQCEIVNDILKLENQIPILVLKEIMNRTDLHVLFYKFCESVSFTMLTPYSYNKPKAMDRIWDPNLELILEQSHHLLHFLYLLMINQRAMAHEGVVYLSSIAGEGSFFLELLNVLASVFQVGFLQQINEAVGLITSLFGLIGRVNKSSPLEDSPTPIIVSASKLKRVKLKFDRKVFAGIKSTGFDKKTLTLTLPVININPFSEVIFRNLIAFEAMAKMDPPCFTQFIALISGLIETTKDVTILKEANIINICSNFGNDEDIVKMFNGLRKTIGSHHSNLIMENSLVSETESSSNSNTSMVKMAEIIKEINQYYESCWRVKAKRFMEKYVWFVLKAVFFLLIILLVIFVVVRTFCGWFSCPQIFKSKIVV